MGSSLQPQREHHQAVLAKGFGQRGYLVMHGAIGLFINPQAGFGPKIMCLERILDGKFISYATPLSSMHMALTGERKHNYNWSFSTNYTGVPSPPALLMGSQDMYGHFGLWILDGPSNRHVQTL